MYMAEIAYYLTEEDRELLEGLLQRERVMRRNPAKSADPVPYSGRSGDTYVAQVPAGGIPAISGVTPGVADCQIYQVVNGNLQSIDLFTKPVYNPTTTAVAAGSYTPITRDKYGGWLVTGGGGGGAPGPPGTQDQVASDVFARRWPATPDPDASLTVRGYVGLGVQMLGAGDKYFNGAVGVGFNTPAGALSTTFSLNVNGNAFVKGRLDFGISQSAGFFVTAESQVCIVQYDNAGYAISMGIPAADYLANMCGGIVIQGPASQKRLVIRYKGGALPGLYAFDDTTSTYTNLLVGGAAAGIDPVANQVHGP